MNLLGIRQFFNQIVVDNTQWVYEIWFIVFIFPSNYTLYLASHSFIYYGKTSGRSCKSPNSINGCIPTTIFHSGKYITIKFEIPGVKNSFYFVVLLEKLANFISGVIKGIIIHKTNFIVVFGQLFMKGLHAPVIHLPNTFSLTSRR